MSDPDTAIDALYQGDLAAFVAARNALAKALKRPDLKSLEKPTAPAWAVNHLFWHDRAVFDRVVDASEALRAAHRDALSGRPADLRTAETTHRSALREALAASQRLLTGAGHAASPATIDAIRRTLEALPHPDANGRLVEALSPAGLEALAGLTVAPAATRPAASPASRSATSAPPPPATAPAPASPSRGPATVTRFPVRPGAEARADAAKALREREAAAREAREREAKAREARQREAEQMLRAAAKDYERAQAAVADAETALSEARKTRDAAAAAYEKAKRAARDLV